MSTISDKVLDKIKQEHLKPKPRWQFRLRVGGQWLGFALFALLGIAAITLLMHFWSENPLFYGSRFGFGMLLGRMPLLLLLLGLIGALIAVLDFKNTGRGYRFSLVKLGLALAALILLAGWMLNYLGLAQRLDYAFKAAPYYQDRQSYMMQVWQRPEEGLISGEILEIRSQQDFILVDLEGKRWQVDATDALWHHNLSAAAGLDVRMIGQARDDFFRASDVMPWMGTGKCRMMQRAGGCGMMR